MQIAAVLRKSSGSRSVSEVSFVPGIGNLPAASPRPLSIGTEILPRPNKLPRRSRTFHRTRVGKDSALAGSEAAISSSSRLEVLGATVHGKGPDILQSEI